MNKLALFSIIILLGGACTHNEKLYDTKNFGKIAANCETSEDFVVPVKEGFSTIVTYGGDTLAVASQPITIKVPKDTKTRGAASSQIKLEYAILKTTDTYSKFWQAVMFEDTKTGDYDYNDLVIHVRNWVYYKKDYTTQFIEIQPIALGNQKIIKLGCVLCDHSVHVISDDVRRDLFKGEKGFINTENGKTAIRYALDSALVYNDLPAQALATIAWFIEVDGQRYFAISGDFPYSDYDQFNAEGMPYGLVIFGGNEGKNNGTFSYPLEETSIFEAYPDFRGWINGEKSQIGANVSSLCYSSWKNGGFNIWDYKDIK